MNLPDLSSLRLHDPGPDGALPRTLDVMDGIDQDDRYMIKLKNYCKSLPYQVESNERMQEMLDFILLRLTQCLEAKDYDPGLQQWDSMLI
jgi:proteasome activator subunit 4